MKSNIRIRNTTEARCSCKALRLWSNLFKKARGELINENWRDAVSIYAMATEAANSLLEYKEEAHVLYFLRTNMEFIYAARKSASSLDVSAVATIACDKIKHFIAENPCGKSFSKLILPLNDVAYAPLSEVDYRLNVLFAMEESAQSKYCH